MDLFDIIKKRFATAFGKRISEISNSDMAQVRELTARDFIDGSLFDNEAGYVATPKADGVRKLLFFYERGVYTIELRRRGEFNIEFVCTTPGLVPTAIIDSEKIEDRFLCFDLIYFEKRVEEEDYLRRLKMLDTFFRQISPLLRSLPVKIEKKMVMVLYTKTPDSPTQNFFDKVNALLSTPIDYPVDGIIFTPIRVPFDRLRISENPDLRLYPESCKWKFPEMLSIDFVYRDRKLYSRVRDELIPFEAPSFSFEKNVDFDSFEDVRDGDIIEVKASFTSDPIKLIYSRHRPDKFKPNGIVTAKIVWKNMLDPLTVDTISGKNFYLVRKYHNSIKRELLQYTNSGSLLLDIGSGRGGDLSKFNNFSKILCIEPNPEFAEEFRRRLVDYPSLRSKLTLLEVGCCSSDLTKRIISYFGDELKEKKIYISSMLSLSFFWKDRETTNSLIRMIREICSIAPSVEFIYLTVDGKLLKNLFDRKGDYLNLGPAILNRSGNEVNINIDNSIVTDQTEYFVDVDDIQRGCYFSVKKYEVANENDYMSNNEKVFSSVYTYGRMVSTKKSRYLSPGEKQQLQIEKDIYELVGVEREDNKKKCLSFFGYEVEDFRDWESAAAQLRRKILIISYEGFHLYEAEEESDLIFFEDLDGYCYPLIQK